MSSIRIPNAGKRLRERTRSVSFSPIIANGIHEKHAVRGTPSWTAKYLIPLPWPFSQRSKIRQSRIILPSPRSRVLLEVAIGRARQPWFRKLLLSFVLLVVLWNLYALARKLGTPLPRLPFHKKPTTLVFSHDDLRRIWEWEIASGHYQSSRQIPEGVGLESPLLNPGLPKQALSTTSRPKSSTSALSLTVGSGLKRTYLDLQTTPPTSGFPPRPVPGSIADLDIVLAHCDFSNNKYVRDCLEVLRVGAGLDNGRRVRRGKMEDWKYIYVEEGQRSTMTIPPKLENPLINLPASKKRENIEPPLHLPPPRPYRTSSELATACDPHHPRIFHIFWGGPFTAHPHAMLLSFLFTQNLGLHLPVDSPPTNICRPQFWVWIQTGLAREAIPKPNALRDMFDSLKANPWSAPFLHPRFRDIIKFKLWNTTEQLDSLHELRDEWRSFNLFNSGGHVYHVPKEDSSIPHQNDWDTPARGGTLRATKSKRHDDIFNRMGSASSSSYDRMRTILSDMARFVLCHRFGGIYLDADTILLRDWEELWNWKGAFAYRWSRLPLYNTAVLKLNQGSALGAFLIRTALRQGLDFHPMTAISQYIKDANLDGLLLRLPDALFDSPWLNVENFQRDRPPSPPLTDFQHFFSTPASSAGEAQSVGFDGFFRGAYSYHWHNHWWMPFDPARNWPDLGPRFANAEQMARLQIQLKPQASGASQPAPADAPQHWRIDSEDRVADDKRDLDWATVLKRTFESYIRGERPNMYGEWIHWS